jgi:8-oxo-dGTP pyrophosphatase MutT (NUDIX family)
VLNRRAEEAEVVGAVILDDRGRAFVQRRSANRRLFPNCWDIVGGHVESGETPEQALEREVAEETGWRLREIVRSLGEFSWLGSDGLRRHEQDFLVTVDGDLRAPQLEWDKHPEYRWIGVDELDVMLEHRSPSDDALRRILSAALA